MPWAKHFHPSRFLLNKILKFVEKKVVIFILGLLWHTFGGLVKLQFGGINWWKLTKKLIKIHKTVKSRSYNKNRLIIPLASRLTSWTIGIHKQVIRRNEGGGADAECSTIGQHEGYPEVRNENAGQRQTMTSSPYKRGFE